ncbi:MAG: enoyl-CoA hydratase/isomerase family protein [Promethearchaeota archaeon]
MAKMVEFEKAVDGTIGIIRLNRPNALNSLNMDMAKDFVEVMSMIEQDGGIRAVVVTGNGRAFCAGGDLSAFKSSKDPGSFLFKLASKFHEGIIKMRQIVDVPFVAAINGFCFGVGLSLACACDIRIADSGAKFACAFTGVGLSPDSGLPYFLPRIVGLAHATELAFLNPTIDSKRALEINLITKIISGNLMDDALVLAGKLAKMPTKALGMVKRLHDRSYEMSLQDHLMMELKYVRESAKSDDFQEGCDAFFEKRKPHFKGK